MEQLATTDPTPYISMAYGRPWVSGSSVGPLIERCKELGAQSIIEKPFRSEDILRAISHKTDTEAA